MKNIIITLFICFAMVSFAYSEEEADKDNIDNIQVPSLGGGITPLTLGAEQLRNSATGYGERLRYREIEAVNLSEEWQNKYDKPVLGEGGRVIYHYGQSLHSVICKVLNITDIELQRGEIIQTNGVQIGDNVRWKVTPILSGDGITKTTHLIIKPTDINLNTTMVVATNRRTYHFNLKSTDEEYMVSIAFSYPNEQKIEWLQYYAEADKSTSKKSIEIEKGVGLLVDELNFNYNISGDKPIWLPIRVFNDGQKTYIQMPKAMKQYDAPAFLAIDDSGDKQIVNYRIRGDKFIVDSLFDKGILITGVGRKQQKVTISYQGSTL